MPVPADIRGASFLWYWLDSFVIIDTGEQLHTSAVVVGWVGCGDLPHETQHIPFWHRRFPQLLGEGGRSENPMVLPKSEAQHACPRRYSGSHAVPGTSFNSSVIVDTGEQLHPSVDDYSIQAGKYPFPEPRITN